VIKCKFEQQERVTLLSCLPLKGVLLGVDHEFCVVRNNCQV